MQKSSPASRLPPCASSHWPTTLPKRSTSSASPTLLGVGSPTPSSRRLSSPTGHCVEFGEVMDSNRSTQRFSRPADPLPSSARREAIHIDLTGDESDGAAYTPLAAEVDTPPRSQMILGVRKRSLSPSSRLVQARGSPASPRPSSLEGDDDALASRDTGLPSNPPSPSEESQAPNCSLPGCSRVCPDGDNYCSREHVVESSRRMGGAECATIGCVRPCIVLNNLTQLLCHHCTASIADALHDCQGEDGGVKSERLAFAAGGFIKRLNPQRIDPAKAREAVEGSAAGAAGMESEGGARAYDATKFSSAATGVGDGEEERPSRRRKSSCGTYELDETETKKSSCPLDGSESEVALGSK